MDNYIKNIDILYSLLYNKIIKMTQNLDNNKSKENNTDECVQQNDK